MRATTLLLLVLAAAVALDVTLVHAQTTCGNFTSCSTCLGTLNHEQLPAGTCHWCSTMTSSPTNGTCQTVATACSVSYDYTGLATCTAAGAFVKPCSAYASCSTCVVNTGCVWCANGANNGATGMCKPGPTAMCTSAGFPNSFGTLYSCPDYTGYSPTGLSGGLLAASIIVPVLAVILFITAVVIVIVRRRRQGSSSYVKRSNSGNPMVGGSAVDINSGPSSQGVSFPASPVPPGYSADKNGYSHQIYPPAKGSYNV